MFTGHSSNFQVATPFQPACCLLYTRPIYFKLFCIKGNLSLIYPLPALPPFLKINSSQHSSHAGCDTTSVISAPMMSQLFICMWSFNSFCFLPRRHAYQKGLHLPHFVVPKVSVFPGTLNHLLSTPVNSFHTSNWVVISLHLV